MNNADMNRFDFAPASMSKSRSKFSMNHSHTTTFNAGDLIPFKCLEVLPGDTVSLSTAAVCRMSTPIFPVMDNAFIDIYYFFVPSRLTWVHTKEFYGENTDGPWAQEVEYEIPALEIFVNRKGSIYDQFGLPLREYINGSYFVDARPIRAYGLIWNNWFRNQNISAPVVVSLGDSLSTVQANNGNNFSWFDAPSDFSGDIVTDWVYYGIPLPVAKFKDYFTSALPQPQKGPAVELTMENDVKLSAGEPYEIEDVKFYSSADFDGYLVSTGDGTLALAGSNPTGTPIAVDRTNLYANTTGAGLISVNTLRTMAAMQRLFEIDARSGTRFHEVIQAHFGVKTLDARVQIPEFLAGDRVPITMQQVPQTSATNDVSPQGNVSAYSLTQSSGNASFTYSATEPGFIIGVCCVRTAQSYSQGIPRMWSRRRKFDLYWPVFANLGEQPVYEKEIYAKSENPDNVYGYQEAWAEYKYQQNTVSGEMRPDYASSLAAWNYAIDLGSTPTLSPEFIYETRDNIDRTLAVKSSVQDQFHVNFYFDLTMVRPMPMYSIPSLESHF